MRKNNSPAVSWGIGDNSTWLFMILSITIPVFIWLVVSNSGLVKSLFLPTPQAVLSALQKLWATGDLQTDIGFSLLRVLGGFLLAAVISIPLGVLMGSFPVVRALLEPAISIFRYMPAPAFIPLLILYFGLGETPKILLIFIGTVFFNTLMIMDAVKFVSRELIETSYTLGGQHHQILLQVILPFIVPNIIDACRVNMAASWNLVIVAELVAATDGLGRRISVAQRFLKTDEIFAGLIVIGVIGVVIDIFLVMLHRIVCKWAHN